MSAGAGGRRRFRKGSGGFRRRLQKCGRVPDGNAKNRFWKVPEGFDAMLSAAAFGRVSEGSVQAYRVCCGIGAGFQRVVGTATLDSKKFRVISKLGCRVVLAAFGTWQKNAI